MGTQRVLSWLIVLAGLILIVTPWLVGFATDRAARLDVHARVRLRGRVLDQGNQTVGHESAGANRRA